MRCLKREEAWTLGALLALTVLVWGALSWPLPLRAHRAIPATHESAEPIPVRTLVPGDHLQLLYHFDLVKDMLSGRIPPLHNVYEFNTEGDADRYEPGGYYLPFSLLFALLAFVTGPAAAWNLTGLVSLALTAWWTYLLVRRYSASRFAACLAAAVALVWPYRWYNLLGGSPTGFAMAWVPLAFLGLDEAVRKGRWQGGLTAALAILFSAWGDPHTFFFTVLASPFFCIIAFLADSPARSTWIDRTYQALLALLPVAGGVLAAYLFTRWGNSAMGEKGARHITEVALFAPQWPGFLQAGAGGASSQIFVGRVLVVLMGLAGLLALAVPEGSGRRWGRRLIALALGIGLVGLAVLALGPYGPRQGAAWLAARKMIPPYELIRQTGKVFCLAPTLAALLIGLGFAAGPGRLRRAWSAAVAGLLALVAVLEVGAFLRPALCSLPGPQEAYEAVARDAREREAAPARAAVITLWPGDSHYASVYLYYAQQSGVRLLNGYRPFPPAGYFDDVFLPLERMNQGVVDGPLLDRLLSMGIPYLFVHEDLFPEKVSPFPVGLTLERLEQQQRLNLLAARGPVRAYRIEPDARSSSLEIERGLFPAWRWHLAGQPREEACTLVRAEGLPRPVIRLAQSGAVVRPQTVRAFALPDLRFLIRTRGQGSLNAVMRVDDKTDRRITIPVSDEAWHWLSVPVQPVYQAVNGFTELAHAEGWVEIDRILLCSGEPPELAPGESLDLPASWFFHAGYSEPGGEAVHVRPDADPGVALFYGPHWPMVPGTYRVELFFDADAAAGIPVGRLTAGSTDDPLRVEATVTAENPAVLTGLDLDDRPLRIQFVYNRAAPVTLERVRIMRVD